MNDIFCFEDLNSNLYNFKGGNSWKIKIEWSFSKEQIFLSVNKVFQFNYPIGELVHFP